MWLASLAFIPQPTADMIQSVTVRHSPVACHCSLYEQPTADMIQSVTVCDSPVAYVIFACMDTAHRTQPTADVIQVQSRNLFQKPQWGYIENQTKDHLTNLTMVRHGNKQKQKQNTNAYNKRSRYRSYLIVLCLVRYCRVRYFSVRLLVCPALWPVDKL